MGARKVGQVAAEAGFDQELLLVVGFGEFEEQDLGREVVDVGLPQRDQAGRQLVRDDLGPGRSACAARAGRGFDGGPPGYTRTLTSSEENRCFILGYQRRFIVGGG